MPRYLEGDHNAEGLRFGIVVSRFNDFVTSKLLNGALETLKEQGAYEDNIEVIRVPGAFEIPQAVKKNLFDQRLRCHYLPWRSD